MNKIVTNIGHVHFRPLHDRVLVQRIPATEKIGRLWIPDIAQERAHWAYVLQVGKEVRGLEVGDKVALPGIAAKYPDWETSDVMLVREADIGGILAE